MNNPRDSTIPILKRNLKGNTTQRGIENLIHYLEFLLQLSVVNSCQQVIASSLTYRHKLIYAVANKQSYQSQGYADIRFQILFEMS